MGDPATVVTLPPKGSLVPIDTRQTSAAAKDTAQDGGHADGAEPQSKEHKCSPAPFTPEQPPKSASTTLAPLQSSSAVPTCAPTVPSPIPFSPPAHQPNVARPIPAASVAHHRSDHHEAVKQPCKTNAGPAGAKEADTTNHPSHADFASVFFSPLPFRWVIAGPTTWCLLEHLVQHGQRALESMESCTACLAQPVSPLIFKECVRQLSG